MRNFLRIATGTMAALAALCLPVSGAAGPAIDRDAAYRSALPLYQYDPHQPLQVKMGDVKTFSDSRMLRFSYASTHGQRVPALLFVPGWASRKRPAPCLVLLHGLGGNKEMMALLAHYAASAGYASLVIDEYGQGERAVSHKPATTADWQASLMNGVPQTVVDVRRGLDYLATRSNIDHRRLGLVGLSLGAIIGTIASGVDKRLKATVLVSGGGDWALILKPLSQYKGKVGGRSMGAWKGMDWSLADALLAPEDPLTFVAHIAPRPVLMECGRKDPIIVPQAAEALYAEARRPGAAHVQIDWYAHSGHLPAPALVYPAVRKWLARNL